MDPTDPSLSRKPGSTTVRISISCFPLLSINPRLGIAALPTCSRRRMHAGKAMKARSSRTQQADFGPPATHGAKFLLFQVKTAPFLHESGTMSGSLLTFRSLVWVLGGLQGADSLFIVRYISQHGMSLNNAAGP